LKLASPGPGAFFNFRNSGRGPSLSRTVPSGFRPVAEKGALGPATNKATGFGAPAAGAPPPGSRRPPPPTWAPVGPSAVASAAHELGRVGCRLWGVGAAVWCPKCPVPLSRLFGGGLESHINPLKSVGTASGWCGVGHHQVLANRVCAREGVAIRTNTSTENNPNPNPPPLTHSNPNAS
jgi:hypothetical protein